MQVRHLSAYDVAPETISAFRAAVGETLLPAQELAVREGLLGQRAEGQGQNLLIAAPTSAGKSFIGEMAAVHAAQSGRRVLFLVPLKAMAEEIARGLQGRYQALDLKVVLSTRDHRDGDEAIESGEFHVAVLVFEKLQSLLVTRPELLGKVGLIVVDELQLLTDQGRGSNLELLLTKIRRAQRLPDAGEAGAAGQVGPQLVCLSAPLCGLDELAAWLGAHVVLDERRPVELRSGVMHRGRFVYRSSRAEQVAAADEPRTDEELYSDPGEADGRDVRKQLMRTVAALSRRGEQTLVFVPDKQRCLEAARDVCSALEGVTAPAGWALDEIYGTEDGQARQALLGTLRRGVAFHNSDLSPGQREIVERAFRRGEVRVLCSTSTLAMGLNLPAKNVVLAERWKWRYSRRYNKWVRDELTKVEYDGMSGRAGRLGLCDPVTGFGRSLLIAPSRFDAEVWMRTLIGAAPGQVEPTLLGKPLGDVVLDVVASGLCRDEVEIVDFLLSTYTGYARWARQPGREAFSQSVHLTVEDLLRNDLLASSGAGGLAITAIGRVCARKGLAVRSGVLMARWADAAAAKEVPLTPLEVLLVCALTPDGGEAHVPLSLPEHRFGDYWTRILLKAQEIGVAERRVFRWLRDQRGRLTYEQTKAVKKALVLHDWIDSHDSLRIEQDHSVWSGAVSHAAADFAWLADALREMCDARGWPSERSDVLGRLAEQLRYGVPEALLPLARATGRVLSRGHLSRMAEAGVTSEEGLLMADERTLTQALGDMARRGLMQKIYQIQAAQREKARIAGAKGGEVAAPRAGVVLPMVPKAQVPQTEEPLAVELDEPGEGARLVHRVRTAPPVQADLPLDQLSVTGKPLPPRATGGSVGPVPRTAPTSGQAPGAIGAAMEGLGFAIRPVLVRRKPSEPSGGEAPAAKPAPELVLLSETGPRRCYIELRVPGAAPAGTAESPGGRRAALSPGSFALLARLALGEVGESGWVEARHLGASAGSVRKTVSRLRSELRQVHAEGRSWVENDGHGNYRLSLAAPRVVADREALQQHPLAIIRAALPAA